MDVVLLSCAPSCTICVAPLEGLYSVDIVRQYRVGLKDLCSVGKKIRFPLARSFAFRWQGDMHFVGKEIHILLARRFAFRWQRDSHSVGKEIRIPLGDLPSLHVQLPIQNRPLGCG